MVKKSDRIVVFLVIIILFGIYLINHGIQERKKIELQVPRALPGSTVSYFHLNGESGQEIHKTILSQNRFSVIFIFSQRCLTCEPNILFWNKIAALVEPDSQVFGVVLASAGAEEAAEILKSKRLRYKIYSPDDIVKFKDTFNVEFNLSQTIVVKNNKILFSKAGYIGANDYFKIKQIIKRSEDK